MRHAAISLVDRLAISAGAIAWFILVMLFVLGFAVVGVFGWGVTALVCVVGAVAGLAAFCVRYLFKRHDGAFRAGRSALLFALAGSLAAMGVAGFPVYYLAYWVDAGPTTIPLATLSNGKRTVVFQGMQHVASEDFYKSVVFDLEKALTDGYTLFYEGVQPVPDQPGLEIWFNRQVLKNRTDLSATYKALADTCSMKFQLTYFEPLLKDAQINPKRHVQADVSYLDLKNEYDRLMREDRFFAAAMTSAGTEKASAGSMGLDWIMSRMTQITPAQKRVIGIVCRGIMAVATGPSGPASQNDKLILDYRNKALARFVRESQASKIYITYGAKHFRGFITELRKADPKWEVRSLNWGRSMSNPREELPPAGDWATLLKQP